MHYSQSHNVRPSSPIFRPFPTSHAFRPSSPSMRSIGNETSTNVQMKSLFDTIEMLQEKRIVDQSSVVRRVQRECEEYGEKQLNTSITADMSITLNRSNDSIIHHDRKPSTPTRTTPRLKGPTNQSNPFGGPLGRLISEQNAKTLNDFFQGKGVLDEENAIRILNEGAVTLKACPNISRVEFSSSLREKRVVVVGDIHGQYADLYTILQMNGWPSATNVYVFNGDYVDRGTQSCEVFLMVLTLKIVYPDYVTLNRGNHESRPINLQYGFLEEILRKGYPSAMFNLFCQTFANLQVMALIGDQILVVHGGVSRYFVNQDILSRRSRFHIDFSVDPILDDFYWSDPMNEQGWKPSPRNAGIEFGPDITTGFLKQFGASRIIRSHQVKDEGYEMCHNGKCITVFSASNYTGSLGNKGAVAIVSSNLDINFRTYFASDSVSTPAPIQSDKLVSFNITALGEAICEIKYDLLDSCREIQAVEAKSGHLLPAGKNKITISAWEKLMQSKIPLKQEWKSLLPYIKQCYDQVYIDYEAFLASFQLQSANESEWHSLLLAKIYKNIISAKQSLKDIFTTFDSDGDGRISDQEFKRALQAFDIGLTDRQISIMMKSIDANQDGYIDYAEFSDRFRMKYNKDLLSISEKDSRLIKDALDSFANVVTEKNLSVEEVFQVHDTNQDGVLSSQEFSQAVRVLCGIELSAQQALYICNLVDGDGSGTIDIHEFGHAFLPIHNSPSGMPYEDNWQDSVLMEITSLLFRNRTALLYVFCQMDKDNSGKISCDEFVEGFHILCKELSSSLSDVEILALMKSFDKNNDGVIDYIEFVDGFSVRTRLEPVLTTGPSPNSSSSSSLQPQSTTQTSTSNQSASFTSQTLRPASPILSPAQYQSSQLISNHPTAIHTINTPSQPTIASSSSHMYSMNTMTVNPQMQHYTNHTAPIIRSQTTNYAPQPQPQPQPQFGSNVGPSMMHNATRAVNIGQLRPSSQSRYVFRPSS